MDSLRLILLFSFVIVAVSATPEENSRRQWFDDYGYGGGGYGGGYGGGMSRGGGLYFKCIYRGQPILVYGNRCVCTGPGTYRCPDYWRK